ncbi:MAG TPA: hypothetical protein VF001_01015 [Candidatus Limnocylindria bacterium]
MANKNDGTAPAPRDANDEVEQQDAAELPDREEMSLVNANIAIPVNAAVAANVLSDGSVAYADATQQAPISQGNVTSNPLGGQ